MIALGLILLVASATPSLGVEEAVKVYNAASERPLPLRPGDVSALEKGLAVSHLVAPAESGKAWAAVGLLVVDVPRDELWITIRDGHLAVADGLTERHISGRYDELDQEWFGMLVLPPPFRPRHWRIHTRTEVERSRKTMGRAWESTWIRHKDGAELNRRDAAAGKLEGITAEDIDRGLYTVENEGSWLVIELSERRSLMVYRASVDLGGVIPSSAVGALARLRLKQLLRQTARQVPRVREHYANGHALILGGDGRPLPTYGGGPSPKP